MNSSTMRMSSKAVRTFIYSTFTSDNLSFLCGFPSFCTFTTQQDCRNTTLLNCNSCSIPQAISLSTAYLVVGIVTLLGNSFVLWNVFMRKKGHTNSYSKIRASLAIANVISGLEVGAVVLPNIYQSVYFTAQDLIQYQLISKGSFAAVTAGIFYLLGFTSSLYHLVYLSSQRVYAIALPLRYRTRSIRSTYIGLALVWVCSIVSSTFPVWFPGQITFSYYSTIFLYFPSYVTHSLKLHRIAITTLILLIVYPYVLMTFMSLWTVVMVFGNNKKRLKNLSASKRKKAQTKRFHKHEINLLKTIVCMQIGFTLALIPLATVTFLFYSDHLRCTTSGFSTLYLICFLLSMSNSWLNVVIYFIFDQKFRSSILKTFLRCPTRKVDVTTSRSSWKRNNELISTSKASLPELFQMYKNTP